MMTHRIIHGDVFKGIKLIPDNSVQEIITSYPYLWLRDYGEEDQLGLEETPDLYIWKLVELSREVRRVLRDDGIYFVNIGDTYVNSGKGPTGETGIGDQKARQGFINGNFKTPPDMKTKDLMGIPWMLAEALRKDGWYWRKWFPWIKRNCMPESVFDRPASSLEIIHMFAKSGDPKYWVHQERKLAVRVQPDPDYIFKNKDTGELTRTEPADWKTLRSANNNSKRLWSRTNLWTSRDYFWDPDAIRVEQSLFTNPRGNNSRKKVASENSKIKVNSSFTQALISEEIPGGRNRRDSDWFFDSWEDLLILNIAESILGSWQGLLLDEEGDPMALIVNPQPFREKHFATFPENLVKPLLLGATSEKGCCPACGAPYIRIVDKGDPLEEQRRQCGANAEGGYNGTSWKHEKLIHGKRGHFHEKEKKQNQLGKQTYSGFNERYQQNAADVKRRILAGMKERIYHWVPSCDCNAGDPIPCTVLDIFAGRGTVTKVARDFGRSSIGCELSEEYLTIMKRYLGIDQVELETGDPIAKYIFEEAP